MKQKCVLLALMWALCAALLGGCGVEQNQASSSQEGDAIQEEAVPSWQEQYNLGMGYLSEENYEEAIAVFTAAIELDPEQVLSCVGRGDAYALSGDTEENLTAALADYEAALAMDEAEPAAWLGKADVAIRRGKYDLALETLREGLEKTGSNQAIADKIAEVEKGSIKDSAGHLRRKNGYNKAGEMVWYHTYTYNDHNKHDSVTSYDASGTQTGYLELDFDEEGRRLTTESYAGETGELIGYTEVEYDENGNKVKSTYCRLDGEPVNYWLYEYDETGKRIHSERYDSKEDRLMNVDEYDEQGNMVQTTWYEWYTPGGGISGYYTYEYDSDGRQTRYNSYDANWNLEEYSIYLYDENGRELGSEHYDADGSLKFSTAYES